MWVVATCVVAGLALGSPASAQTRGILGFDSGTDSGFLRLFGTNGNSASRLWVTSSGNDRGILQLYDDGDDRVVLQVDSFGQGLLSLRGSTDNHAARLTVDDGDDAGILWLYHNSGQVRAALEVDGFGQGVLVLDGSDNVDRARLTVHDDTDSGFLRLRGEQADSIVEAGRVGASSPDNGSVRVLSSGAVRANLWTSSSTDSGYLYLYNPTNIFPTIWLNGATGDIWKSGSNGFRTPHPKDPSREILYTSLEGPERGMYVRGSAKLRGGRATIELPEHFSVLANPKGMTVQLTPGSAETYGLAAVRKTPEKILVQELGKGKGSFAFDYVVYAARKDLPPLQVMRKREAQDEGGPTKAGGMDKTSLEKAGHEASDADEELADREPVDSAG
ncbi:MAG: hypothetical protein AAF560_32625 [Acidobacteriota bacterium]